MGNTVDIEFFRCRRSKMCRCKQCTTSCVVPGPRTPCTPCCGSGVAGAASLPVLEHHRLRRRPAPSSTATGTRGAARTGSTSEALLYAPRFAAAAWLAVLVARRRPVLGRRGRRGGPRCRPCAPSLRRAVTLARRNATGRGPPPSTERWAGETHGGRGTEEASQRAKVQRGATVVNVAL